MSGTAIQPSPRARLSAGLAGFAAASIGSTAVAGLILSQVFRAQGDLAAIEASALVAIVIQLTAFRVARLLVSRHLLAAMGAGALVRLAGLVVYALLAIPRLGLPFPAALISLAVFYFLSMLLEPLFLRP